MKDDAGLEGRPEPPSDPGSRRFQARPRLPAGAALSSRVSMVSTSGARHSSRDFGGAAMARRESS